MYLWAGWISCVFLEVSIQILCLFSIRLFVFVAGVSGASVTWILATVWWRNLPLSENQSFHSPSQGLLRHRGKDWNGGNDSWWRKRCSSPSTFLKMTLELLRGHGGPTAFSSDLDNTLILGCLPTCHSLLTPHSCLWQFLLDTLPYPHFCLRLTSHLVDL